MSWARAQGKISLSTCSPAVHSEQFYRLSLQWYHRCGTLGVADLPFDDALSVLLWRNDLTISFLTTSVLVMQHLSTSSINWGEPLGGSYLNTIIITCHPKHVKERYYRNGIHDIKTFYLPRILYYSGPLGDVLLVLISKKRWLLS